MKVFMLWLQVMVNLLDGIIIDKVVKVLINYIVIVEKVEVVGGELIGLIVIGYIFFLVFELQKNGKVINWCWVDVGFCYNVEGYFKNIEEGVEGCGIICGVFNVVEGVWVVVFLFGVVFFGGFVISV